MSRVGDLQRRLRARRLGLEEQPPARPSTPPPDLAPEGELRARLEEIARAAPALHARLTRLDAYQLRAVLADAPAVVVQAQVGSGKTTVLVHKLLALHLLDGVPLEELAVLTFTHKAAGEVRARLAEVGLPAEALWLAGTFHAVAGALLRRVLPVERLGRSRAFQLVDARQREELWDRLIAEHDLDVKYRAKLAQRWEAREGRGARYGNMRRDDDLARLVSAYEELKAARDLLDFEDLLTAASELLPEAPAGWRRPAWILIDELQDTSPEQLELAERLAGPETRLFAVGDPNQVIYSWRGGDPALFDRLARRPGALRLTLPVNYRSTAAILEAARAFLASEGAAAGFGPGAEPSARALVATRAGGEPLLVLDHHDPHAEALYLAERLRRLAAAGCPWEELAVLVRTRRQLEVLRDVLRGQGIPCEVGDGEEGPAVTWLRRLLAAALAETRGGGDDPPSAARWRELLVHPRYGLLARRDLPARALTRPSCGAAAEEPDGLTALRWALATRLEATTRPARSRGRLRAALAAAARLAELPAWLALHADEPALEVALAQHLELARHLGPTTSTFAEESEHTARALTRWLAAARARLEARGASRAERASALAEALAADRPPRRARVRAGRVALLTLHASKGLEFQHVFLAGANAGVLPLASAWRDPAAFREERRLFFVGLTRARESVELSYTRTPPRPDAAGEPSGFLRELPPACVRWLGPGELAERCRALAPPPPAEPEPDPWRLGARVRHRKYGPGEVVAADAERLTVRFAGHGEKGFARALCPLEVEDAL